MVAFFNGTIISANFAKVHQCSTEQSNFLQDVTRPSGRSFSRPWEIVPTEGCQNRSVSNLKRS